MSNSLAIAYAVKKRGSKMAKGGHERGVHKPSYSSGKDQGQSESGDVVRQYKSPSAPDKADAASAVRQEHVKVLSDLKYGPKPKLQGLAEGGDVKSKFATHAEEMRTYDSQKSQKGVHTPRGIGGMDKEKFGESRAGYAARASHSSNPDIKNHDLHTGKPKTVTPSDFGSQAKKEHTRVLEEGRSIHPKLQGLAHGGEVEHDDDFVSRLMQSRANMYSEGGEVANDTPPEADFHDNDFDYLAGHDDLEFHDTGANSGDEDNDHDIVNRIMKKRAR